MRAHAVPFLAAIIALLAAPAAQAFDAHGSARQVYVTRTLAPGEGARANGASDHADRDNDPSNLR